MAGACPRRREEERKEQKGKRRTPSPPLPNADDQASESSSYGSDMVKGQILSPKPRKAESQRNKHDNPRWSQSTTAVDSDPARSQIILEDKTHGSQSSSSDRQSDSQSSSSIGSDMVRGQILPPKLQEGGNQEDTQSESQSSSSIDSDMVKCQILPDKTGPGSESSSSLGSDMVKDPVLEPEGTVLASNSDSLVLEGGEILPPVQELDDSDEGSSSEPVSEIGNEGGNTPSGFLPPVEEELEDGNDGESVESDAESDDPAFASAKAIWSERERAMTARFERDRKFWRDLAKDAS